MKRPTGWLMAGGIAAISLAGLATRAGADCGSVPFSAPLNDAMEVLSLPESPSNPNIDFDPLKVTVFEPKQRAIILWNGKEEVLLLSTDQRSSQKSAVLEVIPLPAEPKVRLGSFATFEKAQALMIDKRMWAVAHAGAKAAAVTPPAGRVTFEKKMGAHDLTVAEARDAKGFVAFVQEHLRKKYGVAQAPIRPDFVKIIQTYLDGGFRWFAFDAIAMDGTVQSREPIEYRFASDSVYYPLRISSLEGGKTEVELLVFTAASPSRFDGAVAKQVRSEGSIGLITKDVEGLVPEWAGFFGERKDVSMDQWRVSGKSSSFAGDVVAR